MEGPFAGLTHLVHPPRGRGLLQAILPVTKVKPSKRTLSMIYAVYPLVFLVYMISKQVLDPDLYVFTIHENNIFLRFQGGVALLDGFEAAGVTWSWCVLGVGLR